MFQKLRPKLRGKLAWGTAIFTGIFIFFLLFFFHQISQDNLKEANMQQAESIFDSVRSAFENYLTISNSMRRLEKKTEKLEKDKDVNKTYKRKKLKALSEKEEKLKEDLKSEAGNINNIFKTRPEDHQVTFISRKWVLLSHSHPEHLVLSRIGRRMPSSTIKAERYQAHRQIISSYKKKRKKEYQPVTESRVRVNYKRGFLSYIQPVFSNRSDSTTVRLVASLFSQKKKDGPRLADFFNSARKANEFKAAFQNVSTDFESTLQKLDRFEKDYIYEQHKQKKEDISFSASDFYKDEEARENYKALRQLDKKRNKQWRSLRKTVNQHFSARLKTLTKRLKFLKENEAEKENILVSTFEIKRLKAERNKILAALKKFPGIYANTLAENEDGWQKRRARYLGNLLHPASSSAELFNAFFGGIAEVRILLDAKIKKSSTITFSMIDVGLSFLLRALFMVFLLSSLFVKDIKALAFSAGKVEKGDLETRFKVDTKDELSDLANAFNQMLVGLKEKEALRLEIEAAAVVQRNLLPQHFEESLSGFDIDFMYRAMTGVGGDYIDLFAVNEKTSCLVVADVSNHGVGPGLVMTMMRSSLRTMARQNLKLTELVQTLNASLFEDTPGEIFVSVFIAYIENKTGKVEYVSCGHNAPYLVAPKKVTILKAGGMALGAMMPGIFNSSVQSHRTTIEKDHFLFQYTDGLTEAFNPQKELLGEQRLESMLQKVSDSGALSSKKIIANSIALLEKFTRLKLPEDGPTELTDDVAIICVGLK